LREISPRRKFSDYKLIFQQRFDGNSRRRKFFALQKMRVRDLFFIFDFSVERRAGDG